MTHSSIARLFLRLGRDRRGVTAIMYALMLVPLFMVIGGAVDLGVAYYLKSRLGYAVDAAALAVGSTVESGVDLEQRARDFVEANYPDAAIGDLEADALSVNVLNDVITVSAKASFDTFFLKLFQMPKITVSADAEVIRAVKGMDVALVLDITGSMRSGGKIGDLKDAATDLVNILFGDNDTHDKLQVGIVPYAVAVNPGAAVANALVTTGDTVSTDIDSDPLGWKGCLMEPLGIGSAVTDPDPDAEYDFDYEWNDPDPSDITDWTWEPYVWEFDPAITDNIYDPDDEDTVYYPAGTYQNGGTGPNLGCPSAITALTGSKQTLLDTIDDLEPWHRGGTLSDIGMAWGIRLVSPEAPFTEGKPWDEPRWMKAIVMMTDGENQLYWLTDDDSPNEKDDSQYSDFSPYGRVDEMLEGIGTTVPDEPTSKSHRNSIRNQGRDLVDEKLVALCQKAEAKNIIVYTVTFGSGADSSHVQGVYRACASDGTDLIPAGRYFHAADGLDLRAAFTEIGQELSKLRVSR